MLNILDTSNDRKTISDEVSKRLSEIDAKIDELSKEKNELRKNILDAMIENNIDRCVCKDGTTFTQIIPSKIIDFDKDAFVMNEPEDVVKCFSTFEEHNTFNEEKFMNENPELYKKYSDSSIETIVDTDKLSKTLPTIYRKYVTEKESNKAISLRVGKKKI